VREGSDVTLSVVYNQGGRPAEVLRIAETGHPGDPGPGEVLVRVTAFPIHPGDLQAVEGAHRPTTADTPTIAGLEATGVLEALGPGVSGPGLVTGARVTVFPHPGAWSRLIRVRADTLAPVPDGVSDDVAAQLLVNPLTVIMLRQAIEAAGAVGYNGVFLQTAATSSVGRLLGAIADSHGMDHIDIVRRPAAVEEIRRRFPRAAVVATSEPGWQREVRRLAADRPVTAAVDPVGGALAGELLGLLDPGGTLITYGRIADEPIPVHASTLLSTQLTIRGAAVTGWIETTSPRQRSRDIATAIGIAQTSPEHFEVAAHYSFDDITAAVEHVGRPGKVGTVIVTTDVTA
jgi:NADPH:quinone reductase-like Zn-dependent oxidoreductase